MRSWLARLVSAEVRRLTNERNEARATALRWHATALTHEARADALAVERTGRCGDSLNTGFGGASVICALPAGHAGWHRSDNGVTEWGPVTTNTKEQ